MKSQTTPGLDDARTFAHLFAILRSHGDRPALAYEDRGVAKSWTYTELAARVDRAAARLQELLGPDARGQFVELHADNGPSWPVLFWALLMAGYRPLLLDARAAGDVLRELVSRAGAAAVVTDRAEPLAPGVRQVAIADALDETAAGPVEPRWEDLIALCTSGTTGTSKLVVFEGSAITGNVRSAIRDMARSPYLMRKTTRNLAFAPFFHVMGLLTYALYTAAGKTTVLMPDRLPTTLKRVCLRDGVNIIYAVPLVWNAMANKIRTEVAKKPLAARAVFRVLCAISWIAQLLFPYRGQQFVQKKLFRSFHRNALGIDACIVSGAAPLPRRTQRTLTMMGFPLLSGYGMTEACVISIDHGRRMRPRLRGSVGQPLGPTEVRVAAGTERGGIGELEVRSESLYRYELRGGELVPPERPGGWMATGDVGRVAGGHIYILGRSKDVIAPATGEKVYPEAVEEAFAGLPGVEALSVVGLPATGPGGAATEAVCLVVYLGATAAEAAAAAGAVDAALRAAIARANEQLPFHARVTRVLISDAALPATTTMKTQRQVLRRALEAGTWTFRELALTADGAPPSRSAAATAPAAAATAATALPLAEVLDRLRALIAEILQVPAGAVRDDAHFIYDLGGDSLKLLELLVRVEQAFDLIDDRAVLRACVTPRELAAAISDQRAGRAAAASPRPARAVAPVTRLEDDPRLSSYARQLEAYGEPSPYFVPHDSTIRDTSTVDGVELVNFTSYNYLGLSGHPRVVAAAQRAAADLGTSASGSRLLTGEKRLYRQLEQELAAWKRAEDALVLVSGHATNVSFVGNFCGESDLILYDALSHNSVEQGCRLSAAESRAFPHNDVTALRHILKSVRARYERVLIVVEGVYSMDGDTAPIPELVACKREHGAFLMVDEAHSAGVLGRTGGGVDEHFGLQPGDIDIHMGTLSKSLGSCGGYLAGSSKLIEYLRYALPGFVFSVGISPPGAAAALESLRALRADPAPVERLHANIRCFLREARRRGLDTCGAADSAITPILVGDERRAFALSAYLRGRGFFVAPAIYPAVPRGQARLRFCMTSEHRPEQIEQVLDALAEQLVRPAGGAVAAAG